MGGKYKNVGGKYKNVGGKWIMTCGSVGGKCSEENICE